jgi:pimeloyl-ACP methyl ester carboxylesterase
VQVYTTHDPNNPHFMARTNILEAAEKVFATVDRRGYPHVAIVGHSLGSVVAFDSMRRLDQRGSPMLGRIGTIVTVGAALEKVRYFFAQREMLRSPGGSAPIGRPVAMYRHATDELDSAVGLAAGKRWLNLWYANDVVANPITSFGENVRYNLGSWDRWPLRHRVRPGHAQLLAEALRCPVNVDYGIRWRYRLFWPHSDYWLDPTVMSLVRDAVFA